MQSQDSQSQDIRQLLTEFQNFRPLLTEFQNFQVEVRQSFSEIRQEMGEVREELAQSRQEFQEEVKRWDNRFFEFSRDSLNRANTLIASASISVIAGVILLLLRT